MVTEVCRYYGYKLYDIYQLRWRDGGLTRSQLLQLYENLQKNLYDEFVMQARLHGAEFENDEQGTGNAPQQTQPKQQRPLFPDPKEFEGMSAEERKEVTATLIKQHKAIVADGALLHPRKNKI